ncbi:hypothetical protein FEM48_Zijuj05G0020400 [Ziziphus jujuba var. spinosa]|uniref:Uncharacterized protein n=1 Tax=Ziziphus jujuba var. spinosa TaxID=714518 RepID=A0A978VC61_ZIZJJ|nr:hypothetical protein FEM48_Zijuj05G0020400 [Ziziphus jujuba var. spinosa]
MNIMWPDGKDQFCEVVNSYAKLLGDLNEMVIEMAFESYGAKKHYASLAATNSHVLRFLKFKPQETEVACVRLPAHKDLSFATIVHQIDVAGLEVQLKDGTWIALQPQLSHFLFMACEGMQVWSNDRIKACNHRVNILGNGERYSMGLFTFNNGVIQVPDEMVDDEHPLLYNPFDHPRFIRFFINADMAIKANNPTKAFCDFSKEELKPATSSSLLSLCNQIQYALENHGCFIARYDQLSAELSKKIFSQTKDMFEVPTEIKMKNTSHVPYRGYHSGPSNPNMPSFEGLGIDNATSLEETQKCMSLMWPAGKDQFCEVVNYYAKLLGDLIEFIYEMVPLVMAYYYDCLIKTPNPQEWPPVMQIPAPQFRASSNGFDQFADSPNESCKLNGSCPVTVFITGNNQAEWISNQVRCIEGLPLWRNSSSAVNDELFKGYYQKKKPKGNINEILAANDFLNSSGNYFTVSIWFNSTYKFNDDSTGGDESNLLRVPRSVNLASNAYLQFLKGSGTKVLFDFMKEMPKLSSTDTNMIDISSFLNSLFFTWILLLLFRVILTSLVYDKEKKLRIMMKMHGLGDAAYWTISYAYFLFISLIYMLSLMLFGSVLVIAYILVFGSGLVGEFLFRSFSEDLTFLRGGIIALELYPGFSLYRGIYELSQYGTRGIHIGTGMNWRDFNDGVNGMKERENVDQFLLHPDASYSIICDNLKKVYPGKDGNPPKFAVRGLSLALPPGECFRSLGPNGARKTSFLSMVSLFNSLALNVYMDEPSTGLDPPSKNSLWNVVKHAKQNRAIILTTYSMEEAEFLCDRLGIMANGSLQCIGNSKELKARHGGTYMFTMTTSSEHEEDIENLVRSLSINSNKINHLPGTQKYELPKDEVRIADVYKAVEIAKSMFTVSAWGLTDNTVEDVLIKVGRGTQSFNFST